MIRDPESVMSREERLQWREHPEYSDGFADGMDDELLADDASAPFRAGYAGALTVRAILEGAGFRDNGNGEFPKSFGRIYGNGRREP